MPSDEEEPIERGAAAVSVTMADCHIRWMIRKDLAAVLAIEAMVFEYPWSAEVFERTRGLKNIIGMVCQTADDETLGYMVYDMAGKDRIHLLNLAVHPSHQRSGLGTQMLDKLKDKLSHKRRRFLDCEVRERNLAAQLFFKAQGFRAVKVLHGHYEDCSEDAYAMRFAVGSEGWAGNRIRRAG